MAPDRPLRVLFSYSHVHVDTGSPRVLMNLVEALRPPEFAAVYLAPSDGPLVSALRERGAEIVAGEAKELSARRPGAALQAIGSKARLLSALGIDVVHLHEPGWNSDLVLAAGLSGIPVVLHIHNPITAFRRNVNLSVAKHVIFVSQAHMESTGRLELIRKKSLVIYNAVDLERAGRGVANRQGLGLHESDFVVVTVAQLTHRKGIDVLLDCAERLLPRYPDLVFLIAGPAASSEQAFAAEMQARAQQPQFRGRVRFLGARRDVPDILASSNLFCLPTRADPFPVAVIEAMAARLPVVASRVGGIPEMVTSPAFGTLVAPGDSAELSAAIERIMTLSDRGRGMGTAAAESLRGRLEPTAVGSQWRALYARLARRTPGNGAKRERRSP